MVVHEIPSHGMMKMDCPVHIVMLIKNLYGQ